MLLDGVRELHATIKPLSGKESEEGLKKKAEKPAMLKLEHNNSPSHSWWWDSHNSPKHSRWLQSDLRELDEKVKEMLKLIEEDADSFAKRAEMYYQKRPELVSLVEEFYRAYRSLAERYDHLTGEIRQNIPRALQLQYGLSPSCDSPTPTRSTTPSAQRHTYSPLRKAGQALHFIINDEEAQSRSPPPPPRRCSVRKCSLNDGLSSPPPEKHIIRGAYEGGLNGEYEVNHNRKEHISCIQSSDEGFSCSSDSEADHRSIANPLGDADAMIVENLRQEIDRLEKENKCLAESHEKALQCNSLLHDRIRVLEGEYASSRKEVVELEHKVGQLSEENHRQRNKQTEVVNDRRKGIGSSINIVGKEVQEIPVVEIKYPDHPAGEEGMMRTDLGWKLGAGDDEKKCMVTATMREEPNVAVLIEDLQSQLTSMMEENEKQKLAIVERGEEKKEAIRQLCFTIDILHTRNQQLQEVIGVLRKRVNIPNGTVGMTTTSMLFSFESWSKFFTGEWGTSKVSSHPFTVAL